MHVYVWPKETTYWIPHRESDRIPSFVHSYVQYTQRDKNCQNILTNSTLGKCRNSLRSTTIFTIETNGEVLSRLEYHL